jgi:hypothetical protein
VINQPRLNRRGIFMERLMITIELTETEIIRKVLLSDPVRDLIGAGYWNLTEEEEFMLIGIIEDWRNNNDNQTCM